MDLNAAFNDYQKAVDADPEQVALARERRDVFSDALRAEGDVVEVFGSGSLRRSTQLKPVHDVDLIVVFDREQHTDWGSLGTSSQDALDHVRKQFVSVAGCSDVDWS
ncbi:nucleotidyltransferase domain-containing protein [Amycolatopsis sp. NPDC049252]|uniref:nucleotidyltransferase domain-containing protein n=1 Tax=Amycolatopsis sp. NPDC049252 TaxID=3363933 RepID=UPI00371AD9C1